MRRTLAILVLTALPAFASAGCQSAQSAVDILTRHPPTRAAREMEDPASPDLRRKGILWLVDRDYGRRPPYTTRYRQIAVDDPDQTVRAIAIRALNISRDAGATAVFVKGLADPHAIVRLEAAKALANLPDPAAVEPLLRLLTTAGENRDVRIAVADALRHYRSLDVARTLANTLGERDFGVVWQARLSLAAMTGQDFRYDQARWLNYLTSAQQPFV